MNWLLGCLLDTIYCLLYEVFIFYSDLDSMVWADFCTATTDPTFFTDDRFASFQINGVDETMICTGATSNTLVGYLYGYTRHFLYS